MGETVAKEQHCTRPLPAVAGSAWVYLRFDPYLSCTAAPSRCCAHRVDVLLIKIKGIRIYLKALRYD